MPSLFCTETEQMLRSGSRIYGACRSGNNQKFALSEDAVGQIPVPVRRVIEADADMVCVYTASSTVSSRNGTPGVTPYSQRGFALNECLFALSLEDAQTYLPKVTEILRKFAG